MQDLAVSFPKIKKKRERKRREKQEGRKKREEKRLQHNTHAFALFQRARSVISTAASWNIMRVLLPDGEEKGADPPFTPVASTAAENGAAGLAAPSEQHLPVSARSANVPQLHSRSLPREASTEVQPGRTNGKQRPATAARPRVAGSEPSTDNVGLDGNVKDDGRDVDGKSSTATEGNRAAAGTSACDVE